MCFCLSHKIFDFINKRIMSKNLKFNLLKMTKNELNDDKIKIEENNQDNETVSKYFLTEKVEPTNANVKKKKRKSIEIKYENSTKMIKNEENKNFDEIKWYPNNWEKTYELIKEMRKNKTAPVDEMGCHKCSDINATPKIFRFQSLLALMLSSQTKDQVTHAAMERLRNYGCTPEILLATPTDVVEKLIHPVGFFKRKVQYIKKTCEILLRDYNGDIPDTIDGLCGLPGVGPKMGHICMQIAWNKITGIGVDTHVHRICNRLNWVKKQAKTPEETRKQLEDWLPRDFWNEINHLLVGFGQEICLPQNPKCGQCLNKKFCSFAEINYKK